MKNQAPSGAKVDRRIEAEPFFVAGRRIQPIARLQGWALEGEEQGGSFVSQGGRLTPEEIQVTTGDVEEIVSIDDPLQEPIRAMAAAAAVVSVVCVMIMLAARVVTLRK